MMWRWLVSRRERRDHRKLRAWLAAGRPIPAPSVVKHMVIREYAERYGLGTLVETGTYLGSTVKAVRDNFHWIYSIELDDTLHARARARFAAFPHITLLHGDSGEALPGLLPRIGEPSLFWLDGHFSGGQTAKGRLTTPIVAEMQAVLAHPIDGHVILIDDARSFGNLPDYPSLDELRALVATHNPQLSFEVRDDIIRIHPHHGVRA
jgi:hypothetical protein